MGKEVFHSRDSAKETTKQVPIDSGLLLLQSSHAKEPQKGQDRQSGYSLIVRAGAPGTVHLLGSGEIPRANRANYVISAATGAILGAAGGYIFNEVAHPLGGALFSKLDPKGMDKRCEDLQALYSQSLRRNEWDFGRALGSEEFKLIARKARWLGQSVTVKDEILISELKRSKVLRNWARKSWKANKDLGLPELILPGRSLSFGSKIKATSVEYIEGVFRTDAYLEFKTEFESKLGWRAVAAGAVIGAVVGLYPKVKDWLSPSLDSKYGGTDLTRRV